MSMIISCAVLKGIIEFKANKFNHIYGYLQGLKIRADLRNFNTTSMLYV
jgi:hypothetical protein